jgi:hypothetical protein
MESGQLRLSQHLRQPGAREDSGQILAQVARSWTYRSDTAVEFKLRDDIVFPEKLTAEDVAYTRRRQRRAGHAARHVVVPDVDQRAILLAVATAAAARSDVIAARTGVSGRVQVVFPASAVGAPVKALAASSGNRKDHVRRARADRSSGKGEGRRHGGDADGCGEHGGDDLDHVCVSSVTMQDWLVVARFVCEGAGLR